MSIETPSVFDEQKPKEQAAPNVPWPETPFVGAAQTPAASDNVARIAPVAEAESQPESEPPVTPETQPEGEPPVTPETAPETAPEIETEAPETEADPGTTAPDADESGDEGAEG